MGRNNKEVVLSAASPISDLFSKGELIWGSAYTLPNISFPYQINQILQLNNETSYERWKKEVKLWETFTDLTAEKRAPAICLSLTGRAQDAVLELDITKLNSVTGVKELIAKLNTVFLIETD